MVYDYSYYSFADNNDDHSYLSCANAGNENDRFLPLIAWLFLFFSHLIYAIICSKTRILGTNCCAPLSQYSVDDVFRGEITKKTGTVTLHYMQPGSCGQAYAFSGLVPPPIEIPELWTTRNPPSLFQDELIELASPRFEIDSRLRLTKRFASGSKRLNATYGKSLHFRSLHYNCSFSLVVCLRGYSC